MIITNGSVYYKDISFVTSESTHVFWMRCTSNGIVSMTPYGQPDWTKSVCNLMFTREIGVIPSGFTEYTPPPSTGCTLTHMQVVGTFSGVYPIVSFDYSGTGQWVPVLIFDYDPPMYYPKGRNILSNPSFVPNSNFEDISCYLPIDFVPDGNGFPSGLPTLRADYVIASDGSNNYIRPVVAPTPSSPTPSTPSIPTPSSGGPTNMVFPVTFETLPNRWNIDQFPNFSMPFDHSAELGFSSPGFREWQGARVKVLNKGIDHYHNGFAFKYYGSGREIEPSEFTRFLAYKDPFQQAAERMIYEVTNYPSERPSYWHQVSSAASNPTSPDWPNIGNDAAYDLGKYMANTIGIAYNPDTGVYDISQDGAAFLLDEELMNRNNYNDMIRVIGQTFRGFKFVLPNSKPLFYGHVFNGFFLYGPDGNQNPYKNRLLRYPYGYSNAEILGIRTSSIPAYYHPYFKQSGSYWDVSPGYFKNPVIYETIFKRDSGGNLILVSGKPQLRTDTFVVNPYPHKKDVMFACVNNARREFEAANGQPVPVTEKTDVEWMITDIYKWHDYLSVAMLNLAYNEYGDFNTYQNREYQLKTGITHRVTTEEWTYGQNGHWGREVGHLGQMFQILFAWFCGVKHIGTWSVGGRMYGLDDQRRTPDSQYTVKNQGIPAMSIICDPYYFNRDNVPGFWNTVPMIDYWNQNPAFTVPESLTNDYFSRYSSFLGANYSFYKCIQDNGFDYDDPSFMRLWFNIPIYGFKNKEILANGLYQGTKLALSMMYPYGDQDDVRSIELKAGATTINFDLVFGRETKMFYFTIPSGLTPSDITLKYYNIDGDLVHVNGLNDGNKDNHYVTPPTIPTITYPFISVATALTNGVITYTDGLGMAKDMVATQGTKVYIDASQPYTNLVV